MIFVVVSWNAYSIFKTMILNVGQIMGIKIILQRGMMIRALHLGKKIMLVQNFNGIELVLLNNLDCQGVYNARIAWNLRILKGEKYLNEEKIR